MPTMAEYAASGGYARDAQTARNVANMPSSSSSSSSRSKIGGVPATPLSTGSSGFMNPPIAGGSGSGVIPIPMASGGVPAPYKVGDVTYTPGPDNWNSMSQSERDNYGRSISGGAMPQNNSNNGMLFPPKQNGRGPGGVVGVEGGWADGVFYPPLQTPQQGNKNFTVTADMGMGGTPPSAQQVKIAIPGQWPGTPTFGTPAPSSPLSGAIGGMPGTTGSDSIFDTKTKSDISAIANARTAELLAKMRTSTDQAKASFQTSFDRQAAINKDNRVLQDSSFQTNNDPFNGMTGFRKDATNREREISDRQAQQDLSTRLGNADMQYADFQNATESQKLQMIDQMINSERQNAYQQAGLTGYLNGQRTVAGQQLDSSNKFQEAGITGKYNGQDTMAQKQNNITNDHWQKSYDQGTNQWDKTFNQNQTNSDRQYNAGRQDAAANATGFFNPTNMNADQINREIAKNSADYANASPEVQHQLHVRNQYLNGLLGKYDSTGNGDYVGGNPNGEVGYKTIAGRTFDMNNAKDMATLTGRMPDGSLTSAQQQIELANEWKASDESGVISPKLAQLYGIPEGTPTQAAKQYAMTNAIQQENAGTQRIRANNATNSQGTANLKYQDEKAAKALEGEIYGHSAEFKSAQDVNDYFNVNGAYIAGKVGAADAEKLKKSFLAPFNADNKQDNSNYSKALSAAQKDPKWLFPDTDKKALIKEYQDLISSGQNSGN